MSAGVIPGMGIGPPAVGGGAGELPAVPSPGEPTAPPPPGTGGPSPAIGGGGGSGGGLAAAQAATAEVNHPWVSLANCGALPPSDPNAMIDAGALLCPTEDMPPTMMAMPLSTAVPATRAACGPELDAAAATAEVRLSVAPGTFALR